MDFFTVLRADAMFYDAACRALQVARDAVPSIDRAQQLVDETSEKMDEIQSGDQWPQDGEQEFESLAIAMESYESSLSAAYAPFLQALSSVQMLTAASIESHINERAKARLTGREWDAFERCTVDGKWIFFTRMFGCEGVTVGTEPLQGLFRVIKRRNALVHYKPRREQWSSPGVPTNLAELGLTLEAGEDSVNTNKCLIATLAEELGDGSPAWLEVAGRLGYFDFQSNHGSVLTQSPPRASDK